MLVPCVWFSNLCPWSERRFAELVLVDNAGSEFSGLVLKGDRPHKTIAFCFCLLGLGELLKNQQRPGSGKAATLGQALKVC
jgi:hypothetical protein